MTRFLALVTHNWPLKVAAIGLATLLYSGLVLSQDTRTFFGIIPVQVTNQPADMVLPVAIEPVTSVRYISSDPTVQVSTSTFRATADLSGVTARAGTARVNVVVESVQPSRIAVVDWEPRFVTIQLDRLVSKTVPVQIERGTVPPGLQLGEATANPSTVGVSGPSTVVALVVAARADVVIQSSGIDVDQDVPLVPIDALGDARSPVDVEPATTRVTIPVFSDRQSRSVPVNPVVTGTPAAGYEIADVTVTPAVVSVEGDADALATLGRADTEPVSVSGASTPVNTKAQLALPEGVVPVGDKTVDVSITFRQITGTRTFEAGVTLVGARPDRTYTTSTDRVLLTVGGAVSALDRVDAQSLVARLEVAGLPPGSHDVEVTTQLPTGLTLVSASPTTVKVVVAEPRPSAAGAVEPSGSAP
ncbi:MAG: YbbR-like domain-containing protein [Chloroflexota bacterium]